jgi:hypothetical protein
MRPLDGLFVLDFSTLLPGPMATLLLAEAGAEVIKIEPPGGESMRGFTPAWGRDSVNFALLNCSTMMSARSISRIRRIGSGCSRWSSAPTSSSSSSGRA